MPWFLWCWKWNTGLYAHWTNTLSMALHPPAPRNNLEEKGKHQGNPIPFVWPYGGNIPLQSLGFLGWTVWYTRWDSKADMAVDTDCWDVNLVYVQVALVTCLTSQCFRFLIFKTQRAKTRSHGCAHCTKSAPQAELSSSSCPLSHTARVVAVSRG